VEGLPIMPVGHLHKWENFNSIIMGSVMTNNGNTTNIWYCHMCGKKLNNMEEKIDHINKEHGGMIGTYPGKYYPVPEGFGEKKEKL
jgi:hypothetical protein